MLKEKETENLDCKKKWIFSPAWRDFYTQFWLIYGGKKYNNTSTATKIPKLLKQTQIKAELSLFYQ